ncbi:MAG TPA: carboxypeptidase-like regulatory domain-containing protein, partial [Bacteroidota bacterium]|nr:carboxypeptidase-like regulatory domain-containing protein [Bacteroidota bacterium]
MNKKTKVVVVLSFLCSAVAFSGTTGKITGTVKDAQSGEPLVGVNVIIGGKPLGASSSTDGSYLILNAPPGKYTLVASAIGYTKKTVTGVNVSVDLTTTIDFQLESTVLELGKEVVIIAERPVVKKDLTSSEARVDAGQIKTLPVSEISEVLSLQSGITLDAGGGIHIRGGRTSEV